jgi:hypothetical protein
MDLARAALEADAPALAEVTDAMVEAAERAWLHVWVSFPGIERKDAIRAALRAALASRDATIAKLMEALDPFARMGELIEQYAAAKASPINLKEYGEHFLRARAALNPTRAE